MEYCEGGSLQQQYNQFGLLSEQIISFIMFQVLQALVYLHSNGILHRDLKSANLLCDKQMHIKLTDFGISEKITQAESNINQIAGSPYWIAKEVLLQQNISEKSDIWSLGATLYELISGSPPYYDLDPYTAMYRIMNDKEVPNIPTKYPEAAEMIQKCFNPDIKKRPTAKELLKERFITKFNNIDLLAEQKLNNNLLLQDISLSLDSDNSSQWSDDSEEQSQSIIYRRKSKQITIVSEEAGSYSVYPQIQEFVQNALKNQDTIDESFIRLFDLYNVTDQTREIAVSLYDVIQRKQAIKNLVSQILQQHGINDQYKQAVFRMFTFLFLNLQQQAQEDLYEQILMNKYIECMPILNDFIEKDYNLMTRCAFIFLQKIQQFTQLIPVFVSLGCIQYVFSQNMFYEKSRELAIQTIQCIYIISNQQNWNSYYICFISNNKIYKLMLNTLKNLALFSLQNQNLWMQQQDNFQTTNSDYDHRILREHASEHFDSNAISIHQQNVEAINQVLKICVKCGQQQILSVDNVLKQEYLEFFYMLTEYFTQCYYIRNDTKMSKQCKICQNLQQELQQFLVLLLMILSRIHQYVFKSNYPLLETQQIVYQNLDKIMELDHTNQELRTQLVLIIFELFTIDDKYEFIRYDNKGFFQLLIDQKGEIQFGVIKRMAEMPIDQINKTFLQRILDYNIANQIVTYLQKEDRVIHLYNKILLQLIQFKNKHRNLKEKYYYKRNYRKLVDKCIQNFQNQKLIANMCLFCYEEKNFFNEQILKDLIELMKTTTCCSEFILSQEVLIKMIFNSLKDYNCMNQHLQILRLIYNQSDNILYLLKDMQLELVLNCLRVDSKTDQQSFRQCIQWLNELQNCKYLL